MAFDDKGLAAAYHIATTKRGSTEFEDFVKVSKYCSGTVAGIAANDVSSLILDTDGHVALSFNGKNWTKLEIGDRRLSKIAAGDGFVVGICKEPEVKVVIMKIDGKINDETKLFESAIPIKDAEFDIPIVDFVGVDASKNWACILFEAELVEDAGEADKKMPVTDATE